MWTVVGPLQAVAESALALAALAALPHDSARGGDGVPLSREVETQEELLAGGEADVGPDAGSRFRDVGHDAMGDGALAVLQRDRYGLGGDHPGCPASFRPHRVVDHDHLTLWRRSGHL